MATPTRNKWQAAEKKMAQLQELLQKVRSGAKLGSVQLEDVVEVLSNSDFTSGEGLLTTTTGPENTLLHLAAASKDSGVLAMVCQAYKRAKLFSRVMLTPNARDLTPIHVAIRQCCFDSFVLLYRECQELCPEALHPSRNGYTLFHSALENCENVSIMRFLLSQESCLPMLLCGYRPTERSSPLLPLDMAKRLVQKHELYVKTTEGMFKTSPAAGPPHNVMIGPKKKALEKAKEMLLLLEHPTRELKAEENKMLAIELEKWKYLERQEKLDAEIKALLEAKDWRSIEEKYLLADVEETQKISVLYLANKLDEGIAPTLPALSMDLLKVLVGLLKSSSSADRELTLATLRLLGAYTRYKTNNTLIIELEKSEPVVRKVVDILCGSAEKDDLQATCASVLATFYSNLPTGHPGDSCPTVVDDKETVVVQPLLLVKHFSLCKEAKRLVAEALAALGVASSKEPDPGTWTVQQVSFWLSSCEGIECRSEYSQKFSEAGVDGLHLLELSSAEMTGIGVKFVSHQRKLMTLIDDLRRRNMRSMIGKKDVFLSYPHRSIDFARKVKRALNEENYSVWIDEAGIRAGHKWRNEIADGIQNASCLLFVLNSRSANSEYCQDEVALAEEYHKPILTIRQQEVTDMDPALKLMLQRRQWLDFLTESRFRKDMSVLIDSIRSLVGEGSGLVGEGSGPVGGGSGPVGRGSGPVGGGRGPVGRGSRPVGGGSGPVGGGSGPEPEQKTNPEESSAKHKQGGGSRKTDPEESSAKHKQGETHSYFPGPSSEPVSGAGGVSLRKLVLEVVREEMGQLREEVKEEVARLERKLEDLVRRVDMRYY